MGDEKEEQQKNSMSSIEDPYLHEDRAADLFGTNAVENSDPLQLLSSNQQTEIETEAAYFREEDDVFLPNIRSVAGGEEYQFLKETLSWTGATDFWPKVDKTDWIALEGDVILSPGSPTVAIVTGRNANITILGGEHLVFLNSNDVSIEQSGGLSQIYYDPNLLGQINVKVSGGTAVLSNVSLDVVNFQEISKDDGSLDVITGHVTIEYQNDKDGDIYLNDLISGKLSKLTPNYSEETAPYNGEMNETKIQEAPKIDKLITSVPNDDEVNETQIQEAPKIDKLITAVERLENSETLKTAIQNEVGKEIDKSNIEIVVDPSDLYDDDVLLKDDMTEIMRENLLNESERRFNVPPDGQNIISFSDTLDIGMIGGSEGKNFNEYYTFSEGISSRIEDILAIEAWSDFLPQEMMDYFDVD